MCKDSLLSLKTKQKQQKRTNPPLCSLWKKRVVPLGLHYTDVQMCNRAYSIGNSLQRTLGSVLWGEEFCLSLKQNGGAVSQFSIFLYVKRQFIPCTIAKQCMPWVVDKALCIVSSKHPVL